MKSLYSLGTLLVSWIFIAPFRAFTRIFNSIKYIILFLLCCFNSLPIFASFGDSCVVRPVPADYSNLTSNNIYGYVLNQIDTTTYIPASQDCSIQDGTITLCIATPGLINQPIPCEIIRFAVGDKKKLFNQADVPTQTVNHTLKNLVFTAKVYLQDICIFMPTSQGDLPVVCKSMGTTPIPVTDSNVNSCKVSRSCYDPASNYSKSLFNFSGKAIQCVRETLNKILNPEEQCIDPTNASFISINPFSYFQNSLKTAVRAALMMYIIFFGIRIVLNPYKLELNEIAIFVLKIILVLYFSVGIGSISYLQGGTRANDGITQMLLPMLLQTINDFPSMIFNASELQNFCKFSAADYPEGYGFYYLWDSLDCRISYYLGGESFTMASGMIKSAISQPSSIFSGSFAFNIVPLMFRILLGGNIVLVIFTLIFMVILISLLLFFVSSYLVCLIGLYTMAFIAPIFVPFALFERTKGYFHSWLKVTFSFALQPMILAGFISILLVFYDSAIYGSCKFANETIDGVTHFHFDFSQAETQSDDCQTSLGYKLYKIIHDSHNIETIHAVIFSFDIYKEAIFDGYLLLNMLFLAFLSILFFFFSKMMSQFAADITGGAQISAAVIDPTLVMNQAKNALGEGASKIKELAQKASDSKGQGGENASAGKTTNDMPEKK